MVFNSLLAPLISTALFMLGNGYLNTYISIRINDLGHSEFAVGIVSSGFYVGVVLGALKIVHLIIKIGHLRVLLALVGLFNVSCLLHSLSDNIFLWFFLRFFTGISLGGFYVTIESWLLEYSNNKNRGVILALYMICLNAPQAFGQLFLNVHTGGGALPFIFVTILLSLSVIPFAIVNKNITVQHEFELINIRTLTKIASSSIGVCFASGLILSAIYSLLPVYFDQATSSNNNTAFLMFITLLGGMILQYPIGLISDNYDRRKVVIGISLVMICCLTFFLFYNKTELSITKLAVVFFIFGGMSFTLYPVALSIICDSLKSSHIVSVTQALSLIEGVGSVAGPLLAPPFMTYFGYKGLSIYFYLVITCLLIFLLYRILKKERTSHNHFVVAVHTSILASELDPRTNEEEINENA